MKFTTPCFIRKNTPELREKLEEMGYDRFFIFGEDDEFIGTFHHHVYGWSYSSYDETLIRSGYQSDSIDCGENVDLFLALAAMREDSDDGQWLAFTELFIADCHVFHSGDIIHYDEVEKMFTAFEQPMYVRKATPAELISHFTEKGGGE